jgi:pSer/pThr/pTyr-binding forkhead associated (FHA) protein
MSAVLAFILRLFLVVSLYLFIFWAFYTLWREIKIQGLLINSYKIPVISLSIDEEQQNQEFITSKVEIGRDPDSAFYVQDETVSVHHARLRFHENQWWVDDLQSTNGTYLNEERVYTPVVILSGDFLRCGRINIRVTIK